MQLSFMEEINKIQVMTHLPCLFQGDGPQPDGPRLHCSRSQTELNPGGRDVTVSVREVLGPNDSRWHQYNQKRARNGSRTTLGGGGTADRRRARA